MSYGRNDEARPASGAGLIATGLPIKEAYGEIPPGDRARQLHNEAVATRLLYLHRGTDEALHVIHYLINPVAGAVAVDVELVGYTVQDSMLLYIDKVACVFSSALIPQSLSVGWRVVIGIPAAGQARVQNILDPGAEYFYYSMGSLDQPKEIEPLWVQSGQRVGISLHLNALFNDPVTIIGMLNGKLIKPASPSLIGGTK